jgi:hypothetical protein
MASARDGAVSVGEWRSLPPRLGHQRVRARDATHHLRVLRLVLLQLLELRTAQRPGARESGRARAPTRRAAWTAQARRLRTACSCCCVRDDSVDCARARDGQAA